jgi:predicted TIM-barrel fold metal-dependent hydrolase
MVAPAEFILQSMARAGVDRAVLQNARPYGRLNDVFAEAVQQHPNRFIGLADVKESEAHTEVELAELTRAVRDLGLRGVYYANRGLIHDLYRHGFDDPLFEPFWQRVRALGIPVFWELQGVPQNTPETYLAELDRLDRWCGHCVIDVGLFLEQGVRLPSPRWCPLSAVQRAGPWRFRRPSGDLPSGVEACVPAGSD